MKEIEIKLTVNKQVYKLSIKPSKTLLEVLRDDLQLTGAKYGCGIGECGACTVLVDGKPKNSCLILAASVDRKEITTIEGLTEDDKLHPLQEAFVKHGSVECGYCSPGMILTAKALLDEKPQPTEQEVRHYLRGNLCRCTGYAKIVEAVMAAAGEMRGGKHNG